MCNESMETPTGEFTMNLRSAIAFTGFLIAAGCSETGMPDLEFQPGAVLCLARSHTGTGGEAGEQRLPEGQARLEVYYVHGDHWHQEIVEDSERMSFSGAEWFFPPQGESGILTIDGASPVLELWRKHEETWESESLCVPSRHDTGRSASGFEVADVDGDGMSDIVFVSDTENRIAVVVWRGGAYHIEEIPVGENLIATDIDAGDIDGDGREEIFFASREKHETGENAQSGVIGMVSLCGKERPVRIIGRYEGLRPEKLLFATLTGENASVLFCAFEGETAGEEDQGSKGATVRMYRIEGDRITSTHIGSLPGRRCRHLDFGDTDGDGRGELIASTPYDGIWKLTPAALSAESWKKEQIISGSSAEEHAFLLHDFTGDGVDEIYVASDDQIQLRCYWYTGVHYTVKILGMLAPRTSTHSISAHRFEAGESIFSSTHDHSGSR